MWIPPFENTKPKLTHSVVDYFCLRKCKQLTHLQTKQLTYKIEWIDKI